MVATLKVCPSSLQKKAYELMGRHEEQVLINRRDVMEKKVRGGREGPAGLRSEVAAAP